jgi:hypothetical protein
MVANPSRVTCCNAVNVDEATIWSPHSPDPSRRSDSPVPVSTFMPCTLSEVRPYPRERDPQALLPIIPPIVQRLNVEGSGPNRNPCAATACCSTTCTVPGSTVAVRASASIWSTRFMRRLKSSTKPVPTALPATEVPPPREVRGTPSRRHTSSAAATSSA